VDEGVVRSEGEDNDDPLLFVFVIMIDDVTVLQYYFYYLS